VDDREETYARAVGGKRIAVVGPAPSVEGSLQGSLIESHELVVRINRGYLIPDALVADIGRRTDILYHSCWFGEKFLPQRKEWIDAIPSEVSWICTAYPRQDLDHPHATDIAAFENDLGGRIPLRTMPLRRHLDLVAAIGTHPNSGLAAINDLLSFDVATVYVTGFTFYSGERPYRQGYTGEADIALVDPARARTFHAIHDQDRQRRFVERLMAADSRLTVDATLAEILS
jgi:hypothetical protein